jgi:hypothetical protein
MSITLIQDIRLRANNRQKSAFRTVCEAVAPKRVESESTESLNIKMKIPPVVPSTIETSKIIQVKYFVVLNYDAAGLATSKGLKT